MILDPDLSADALAFLRASLTPDEQRWPRFAPTLRPIREVPIGELRTHPDLIDQLAQIAPAPEHRWMLMGAAVLVTARGGVYAFAFSQRLLALRTGGDTSGYDRPKINTPHVTGGGTFVLNDEWISLDAWKLNLRTKEGLARVRALAATAFLRGQTGVRPGSDEGQTP